MDCPLFAKMFRNGLLFFFSAVFLQLQPVAAQPKGANSLRDSAEYWRLQGNFSRALIIAEKWRDKSRQTAGKDSLDYAAALSAAGEINRNNGDAGLARYLQEKAFNIQKRGLPSGHPEMASVLNLLGLACMDAGDFAAADSNLHRALEWRRKALPAEHPDVLKSKNNLGALAFLTGDFSKARIFYREVLDIREKVYGSENSDVLISLNNLANVEMETSSYQEAERLYLKALDGAKKLYPSGHPYIGFLHNNLGMLYEYRGDYARAEAEHRRALDIRSALLPVEHPDRATSLNNLGNVFQYLGYYRRAIQFYEKALELRKKSLEAEHPELAASYYNLGLMYEHGQQFQRAEKAYLEAERIYSATSGSDLAGVNLNQGALFVRTGQFHISSEYFNRGQKIMESIEPKSLPDVANFRLNHGILALKKRNFSDAEKLFKEALNLYQQALGADHPDVLNTRYSLAECRWLSGNTASAASHFAEAQEEEKKLLERYFPLLSAEVREAYLKKSENNRMLYQAFCAAGCPKNPELAAALYDEQLFYKGLLFNTSARWKKRIKTSGDMKLIRRLDEWEQLQQKISNLFASPDSAGRAGLDSLSRQAEDLEKELSRRSDRFGTPDEKKRRNWKEVQEVLKPGEAAIEMVRLRKYGIAMVLTDTSDSAKPIYRVPDLTDTIQYAALILRKNGIQPELVLLPNGNDLEGKWQRYYQNSIRLGLKDENSYNQFWNPLGQKLKGIKKLWFSADGIYHKINLNTLQNPATGRFLMDEIEIAHLGSSRDLLRNPPPSNKNQLASLIGNPDFKPRKQASASRQRSGPDISYFFEADPSAEIAALPGTLEELDSIAGILRRFGWEVEEITGPEAMEEIVKDSYTPRILMLATHGFFREDTTPGSNPLLRSGLLFSGAIKTLREGYSGEGEDGILTAYEAMNLNLDNTELVVLSACETGLGEIINGEGVYGLQRAFQVAGARNLVMSLWKVDDSVTKELMIAFFRNWLSGMDKRNAFIKAQKTVRIRHPEPYYWGGFVLLGI